MKNRTGFIYSRGTGRLLMVAGVVSLFLFAPAGSMKAVTLTIREIRSGQEKTAVEFGNMTVSLSHHTAYQYLDIGHPAEANRKIFLYTANQEAYGKAEAGLVSTTARPPLPFLYRNYPSLPTDGSFNAANESLWSVFLEKSASDFEGRKQAETLLTPTNGRSLVYLGTKIDGAATPAGYRAQIIVEEWSEFETDAPVISHTPFIDVILTGDDLGLSAVVVEESAPVAVTLHYRLQSGSPAAFLDVPATVTPDPGDPNRYFVDASLPSGLPAPAVLEYYFTAVDHRTNASRLPADASGVFRSNLVPETGMVTRTVTNAGGRVDIAVGDPRWPGFSVDIPSASGLQKVTVALKPSAGVPRLNGVPPVRVFEVGPHGAHFNQSATLSIPYLDEDQDALVDGTGINETTLRIYWHDGIEWRLVGGQVDADGNRVTARVSHFSVFALFPAGAPPTVETVRPKEKVFTPNGDGVWDSAVFNIDPMDGDIEIEIYNTRGDRVRRIVNLAEWNGRDDDGNMVENGTYIYRLTGQGLTVTGMLAVAR